MRDNVYPFDFIFFGEKCHSTWHYELYSQQADECMLF